MFYYYFNDVLFDSLTPFNILSTPLHSLFASTNTENLWETKRRGEEKNGRDTSRAR